MIQNATFLDCRGLSAPLTILRIKQAMVGRRDVALPLDVLVDNCCDEGARIADALTGEEADIRLVRLAEGAPADLAAASAAAAQPAGPRAHA